MSKQYNQSMKLLYLYKIFHEKTDENNRLTISEIKKELERYEIKSERKSLYEDFERLRIFGMDIIKQGDAKATAYYAVSGDFEMPELKLLVDAVQSSKFITESKSRQLIKQIQSLCSVYQAETLQSQVNVSGRVKTSNETIYYNIGNIYSAIADDKKISFNYFEYTLEKTQKVKRDGEKYIVSPMALIWNDENYYLLAFEKDKLKHYRVDKMLKIDNLDENRENTEAFTYEDLAVYTKKVFSMFGGVTEKVKLKIHNSLIGVVFDRFGKDIIITKNKDDTFCINIEIEISEQFFGWLAGLGKKAVIVSPTDVKNQYMKHLNKILNAHKKGEK
ncbi:MAG: WYL domain-containing protein [Clostridia bacterium]